MKFSFSCCLFAAVIFLYGCGRNQKPAEVKLSSRNFPQKVSILNKGDIHLELDSVTGPASPCMQVVGDSLLYLNEELGTVYINNLKTKRLISKFKPAGDAASYKKQFQGFLYVNKDSIFLFSYHPVVFLINEAGLVKRKYNLVNESDKSHRIFYRGVSVTNTMPAYIRNNRLYVSSLVVGPSKDKKPLQIELDLRTGESMMNASAAPEDYQGHNYGGLHYDIYSNCYNASAGLSIYSFPASKDALVYDLSTQKLSLKPMESQFISGFTEYDESLYKDSQSDPVGEYFMTTPTYGTIFYDQYRDLYYRFALLPVDRRNFNYEEKNAPLKRISLVVFDKDFNYLGETLLDKNKYWQSIAFVSKEGLNIQPRTGKDETMDFTVFSVEKK